MRGALKIPRILYRCSSTGPLMRRLTCCSIVSPSPSLPLTPIPSP